ncbi:MAG: hypothetical protein AB8F78_03625 [Saprospiraceae bacterium]
MSLSKKIIGIIFALMMILSSIGHFVSPEMYFPMIPDFLPQAAVNIVAGLAELILGIGVFIHAYRTRALSGIFLLMIIFLPVHIWDAMKEVPAIGSKTMGYVRIGIQFVLIYLPWYARK